MTPTHTPPRLSAWRDRLDDRAYGFYSGLPSFLRSRLRRLAYALVPILQCGISAGLAWWIAHDLIGNERPFFAPISAAIALGTGMGKRLRRSVELVGGVVVGVGMGDLLISAIGSGPWQIALVVVIAMSLAVTLDKGAIVATQSASSAILVATLLPPGSGASYERMVDTAVGGVVAVVAMALVPVNPLRRARREAAALLGVASSVLHEVARGLDERDSERIEEALREARSTQPAIDGLQEQVDGAGELLKISPLYRRQKREHEELSQILVPLDLAVRNIRVLARRSIVAVDDHLDLPPQLTVLLTRFGAAVELLAAQVYGGREATTPVEVTRELRSVAAGMRRELVPDAGMTEIVLLAQLRSTLVDMLQVAGLSRISAVATLPPTVQRPAVEPDVFDEWTERCERRTDGDD